MAADLISTPWVLWKIQYSPEFKTEKLAHINNLANLENILGGYDFTTDYFALFRLGTSPDIYDVSSRYAFKHKLHDLTHLDIIRTLYTMEIFRQSFLNGIHFKPDEISLWTKLQKNNDNSGQSSVKDHIDFFLDGTGLYWIDSSIIDDSLKCPWTIGYSNSYKFELAFQDTVESDEHLAILLQERYRFSENQKCIILQSDLLSFAEWWMPNLNNRFVYCAVQTTLKDADRISTKFLLSLTISIFPQIRLIYAAFCYYSDGYLKLGIYLTGKESILLPNLRRFRAGPDDLAFTLAHKLKQIILSELPAESDVKVLIRNAIPPDDFDFTNSQYQFHNINGRNTLQYL